MTTDSLEPATATPEEAQEELIDEFGFFDDWDDRYGYLIDLGRKLPELPDAYRRDEFKLKGCQSQVWLAGEKQGDRLHFHAVSDAAIVSGIIAVLLRVYSDRTADEILRTEPDFIAKIGLDSHLSPTRKNGLAAMLGAIKGRAQAEVDAAGG
jgi:cysteine desulfuration protein SufE